MDWSLMERILYVVFLLLGGLGGCILLFNPQRELPISATVGGYFHAFLRRIRQYRIEQGMFAQRMKQKIYLFRSRVYDMEIYDSSIFLKNIALADKDHAFSADYIYERLMEYSRRLKPVYARMLALYRSGKDQEAFAYLAQCCGSRSAKNFSMVLSKVDRISPNELVEQMEVFQEIMGQQRITAEMKRVQRNSLITTILATISVFIMVLDFAAVAVFMHTLSMLENIF